MPDFAQIVLEYQGMVFTCAYHCLRDRALAEEVAQDVFLELHRVLNTLESPAHIRHGLTRVTAHKP